MRLQRRLGPTDRSFGKAEETGNATGEGAATEAEETARTRGTPGVLPTVPPPRRRLAFNATAGRGGGNGRRMLLRDPRVRRDLSLTRRPRAPWRGWQPLALGRESPARPPTGVKDNYCIAFPAPGPSSLQRAVQPEPPVRTPALPRRPDPSPPPSSQKHLLPPTMAAANVVNELRRDDDVCPVCKTERYMNKDMKLLVGSCLHKMYGGGRRPGGAQRPREPPLTTLLSRMSRRAMLPRQVRVLRGQTVQPRPVAMPDMPSDFAEDTLCCSDLRGPGRREGGQDTEEGPEIVRCSSAPGGPAAALEGTW
ncbi:MAG: hypothetical protein BJ554DRAFT_4562 [Olpidium bornovanus]|uniref:RING-type domain-containing protein n=1 Tax=Olpidium bornovanus TaxID=278681 RepID=A0A8H7ZMU9_9FUNG|nr:MAG: hypothetical protein BJ554DRAFT_4562 [Olpidium bornovanus]